MSYFDWNATAPLHPVARTAWLEASERSWANPSTPYRLGAQARLVMDESREAIAHLLQVDAGQVVFTSGATEANNGLIREMARSVPEGSSILISAGEHPSVRATAMHYWGEARVETIPVNSSGLVDLDWMRERLTGSKPGLVCVMAVNNETGVIQPCPEILELCRSAGVPYHCDAVQFFGKMPLASWEMEWAACAGVTLSAHKIGGPKGVGCLVLGTEQRGINVLTGGSQEQDARAGTENIPGIAAMRAILEHRHANPVAQPLRDAKTHFEKQLEARWPGRVGIHGQAAPRIWNTCSVALPDHRATRWISRLDRHGFQVSSGSACSSGKESLSPVLKAMGVDADTASRTVRISCGWETDPDDWTRLLDALETVRSELDASGSASGPGQVIEI